MARIVECVPNFSEGINEKTIEAIADAVRATPGASLLDVDPGKSTNRTVYTFVGSPEAVLEAALSAAQTAYGLIDMRRHKGEHPRMGALDVCPFIPVSGVTVEECVELSRQFGQRLAEQLNVPVFLYGFSSVKGPHRVSMPQIRSGEYEGLPAKLPQPEWEPDFGPAEFVPSWGATVTGVRKFLLAYNVNLLGTKEQAHRIALNLREKGRGEDKPGRLKACQGIGWWLDEANIAQVSLNLTDMDVTPLHVAYEEAKKDAAELNLAVTGSEAVGLLPLQALLDTADFYIEKEGLMILEEDQKVHLAINRLGLNTLSPFNPRTRIIEYCLQDSEDFKKINAQKLKSQTVEDFVKHVGARTAAPGGGSVSALVGGLGCALATMVGKLTYGRVQWEHLDSTMRSILPTMHSSMLNIIEMIDKDTDAFNEFMAAMKLPKATEAQKEAREAAMQKAIRTAINIPLELAIKLNSLWPFVSKLAESGNINCRSDMEVAARCIETGVQGAVHNVFINLSDLKDESLKTEYRAKAKAESEASLKNRDAVLLIINQRK